MASVPTEARRAGGLATLTSWDGEPRTEPDEHLLDRFVLSREVEAEEAFQELVRRHGPMVLGVCRQVLGRAHDAEDAFQATFLVLARKAGSIRDRRVLGRWLYEVAFRIAVRSKTQAARRRAREREGVEMAAVAPVGGQDRAYDPAWRELGPLLHEEVRRLPEKYRTAVVLCYLEGRTNEEAAALLSWPVGTVKGRLSRARELLRSRLTRRGLALSAALLAARLSEGAVFAEVVPARLVDATTRVALQATRGGAAAAPALPERVAELARETGPEPGPLPRRPAASRWKTGLVAGALSALVGSSVLLGTLAVIGGLNGPPDASPAPALFASPGRTPGGPAATATLSPGDPAAPAAAASCHGDDRS